MTKKEKFEVAIIPNNTWVECKNNRKLRFVTKQTDSYRFEDDGKISGQQPSTHCWYINYKTK